MPRVSEQEEEGVWAELHGTEETGLLREDTGPRSESHRSTDGGKGLGGSIKNKFMEVLFLNLSTFRVAPTLCSVRPPYHHAMAA